MNPEPRPFGAVRVALRVCFGERGWLNLEWMSALQDLQASEAWCPLWLFLRGEAFPAGASSASYIWPQSMAGRQRCLCAAVQPKNTLTPSWAALLEGLAERRRGQDPPRAGSWPGAHPLTCHQQAQSTAGLSSLTKPSRVPPCLWD